MNHDRITKDTQSESTSPKASFFVFDDSLYLKNVSGSYFLNEGLQFESQIGKNIMEMHPEFSNRWGQSLTKVKSDNQPDEAEILFNRQKFRAQIAPIPIDNQNYFLLSLIQVEDGIVSSPNLEMEEQNVIHYEESLHREIISIFDWRQEIEGKNISREWMETALPNLNTSLMQGSGLGALVTTVGAMVRKAKREGDQVIIPSMIFDMLEENFNSTKKLVKTLAEAQLIFENTSKQTESIDLSQLHTIILEEVAELVEMLQIKFQQVQISNAKMGQNHFVSIDTKNFKRVMRELLINAMKYGSDHCVIYVLLLSAGDHLIVKILNPPFDGSIHSIDFAKSQETILFQPFYRHNKYVDERYAKEEFGLGLGLPIIKKMVEDMNGKVYFNLLKSNLYSKSSEEISVSLEFPMSTKRT
ncbi:sensor histidine kinase [Leptospira jelokensis]|uniref:sensor histidine kinase n=1 Tax=Leptospira jelokensis TaxID=2484931 RepID=UPI00109170F4|nr:ATP-binding protein [Leptospira jelokensis]TGM01661.1 ATP-binding protein [Leptospira jelokensis]